MLFQIHAKRNLGVWWVIAPRVTNTIIERVDKGIKFDQYQGQKYGLFPYFKNSKISLGR